MLIELSRYKVPKDECVLWRYMDFIKFISLLESRSLYFCRADKLRNIDPFEATLTRPQIINQVVNLSGATMKESHLYPALIELTSMLHEQEYSRTYINCWHMNERENIKMWEVFVPSYGVAIKTNYERLKASFIKTNKAANVCIVKYLDYNTEGKIQQFTTDVVAQKHKHYEYENELRLIHFAPHNSERKSGLYIKINLDILIQEIYIDPRVEIWFSELVDSVFSTYKRKYRIASKPINYRPPNG